MSRRRSTTRNLMSEAMNRGLLTVGQGAAQQQSRGDRGCRSDEAPFGRVSRSLRRSRSTRRSAQRGRARLDRGAFSRCETCYFVRSPKRRRCGWPRRSPRRIKRELTSRGGAGGLRGASCGRRAADSRRRVAGADGRRRRVAAGSVGCHGTAGAGCGGGERSDDRTAAHRGICVRTTPRRHSIG